MRLVPAALAIAAASLAAAPLRALDENYYEWIAVAPIVVSVEIQGGKSKALEARVGEVIRGSLEPGETIRVDLRRANRERDRELHVKGLQLEPGERWVLLLAPGQPSGEGEPPMFELVRGVDGARPLPAEGSAALLRALRSFDELRSMGEVEGWLRLRDMLTDTDPMLIDTALQMHLKFRRGDAELFSDLRPLLDHPEPQIRERALALIEQLLSRLGEPQPAERERLQSELVARARRDPLAEVRIAATAALDRLPGDSVLAVLDEIAEADPDQLVRYAAAARAYERRKRLGTGPGSAN